MKRLAFALLALLLLSGCVEYDEELWIKPDGSGKANLRLVHRSPYENPEEVMRKAQLPGIHLISSKVSRSGADVIYQVSFTFKNIEAFNNINDQIGTADFWGKITINQEPKGKVSFKRRIALGRIEKDDEIENLFSMQQVDYPVWQYKVHLPWKIVSSNADETNINRKNKTVSWSYDTRALWHNDEFMTVEMEKGLPILPIILIAIVVIMLGFFILWMIRIAKRSHFLDRLEHAKQHEEENKDQKN